MRSRVCFDWCSLRTIAIQSNDDQSIRQKPLLKYLPCVGNLSNLEIDWSTSLFRIETKSQPATVFGQIFVSQTQRFFSFCIVSKQYSSKYFFQTASRIYTRTTIRDERLSSNTRDDSSALTRLSRTRPALFFLEISVFQASKNFLRESNSHNEPCTLVHF